MVAESVLAALDAAAAVAVEYEPLPAILEMEAALADDAPRVWPEHPDNLCFIRELGDRTACEAAFARAVHVTKARLVISRATTSALEGRAAVGEYAPGSGRYTLHAGLQMPHETGRDIAALFDVSPADIHIVSPDIGGGFGLKLPVYQEYLLVLLAAKRCGRPVKWIADRSESFLSDQHARDNISDVALALDANGRFLGLRVDTLANLGAYIGQWSLHVPTGNLGGLAGLYKIGTFDVRVRGVFTNTAPTGAFRGAGRPEASYCIERIIDKAAAELGLDPAELRRINMIEPTEMPYDTGLVFTYDCGDFPGLMSSALDSADWSGFEQRQRESRMRGLLRGIGLACVIESAGGPAGKAVDEFVEIRFDSAGKATLLAGSHSHGQGHETTYRQIANEFLGVEPSEVQVVFGDTDRVAHGRGSFGSRTMMAGGAALRSAALAIIDKGRPIAALMLEAAEADLRFEAGRYWAGRGNLSVTLQEVARTAFNPFALPSGAEIGLSASSANSGGGISFPNGCHVCEVEIDPQTGFVNVLRYHVEEDVGTVINPLLLKGQVQGGVAQGAGQALMEQVVYDRFGQLLSGSFMDYAMPRAFDLCDITVASRPVPTSANPLGAKGAGEAGAVGALPAVMNAIENALRPAGVRHLDMPATPSQIWSALRLAKAQSPNVP